MKDKFYNFFTILGEYSFYGLMFFLSISNALVEIFVLLAFLSFIGRKIIKPDFKHFKFWPNIFLLLFLFFSAISLFNSGMYLKISLHALFGKWMQYLGICVIIQDTAYDQRTFKRGMAVFLFGASLAVFSGLSQHFFGIEFLRHRIIGVTNTGVSAVTSSFSHYNSFGSYLVILLPLLLSLLFFELGKFLALGLIFSIIFTIMVLLFTLSRGSWLGAVVSYIVLAIFSDKKFKRLLSFILVAVLLWFLLPNFSKVIYQNESLLPNSSKVISKNGSLLPNFSERLSVTFKKGGDSDRFRFWLASWKMIEDHPFFGLGVGTFMANFSKYLPRTNVSYAHNCYLQIWAETGIFALFSFLGFIFSFVYLGIKRFIVSKDFLLLGLLSGAVGFLVHSFFDTNLYSLRLAILFWVWVGLILARISRKQEEL